MIEFPSPGIGTALLCAAFSLLFISVRRILKEWKKQLGQTGWIPNNIDAASRLLRTLSSLAWIGCLVALMPAMFDPLIPVGAVAVVVLLAWSQRDSVRDLAAGWMLKGEHTVVPGAYIRIGNMHGRVRRIGFRTTIIDNDINECVVLPNRVLVGDHVSIDKERWPHITFTVHTQQKISHRRLQQHLETTVACSPWAAPGPVHLNTTAEPTRWTIRVRAIDLQFAASLKASLIEEIYSLDMEE